MEQKVTKDMAILDIAQQYPEAIEIFAKYGLGCIGCAAARFETLKLVLEFTVLTLMKWLKISTQLSQQDNRF